MSQAVPFVVFYSAALCLGVGLLVQRHFSARTPEGTRVAAQAAARTATFEAARLWPGLAMVLLATVGTYTLASDVPSTSLLQAAVTGALAGAIVPGATAWLLGRLGLDQASTQISLDGQAYSERFLAVSVLGRTLIAHGVGALVGLLPSLFPALSGASLPLGLSSALVLLHSASLSSNAEAVALVDIPRRGRTLMSLAATAALGFLRPARSSLLISTVSVLVHLELGPSLVSSMPEARNAGTYLMVVQAAAILSLVLGLLSIRRGRQEPEIRAWIRATVGAIVLCCAGAWLAQGVSKASPPLGPIPVASILTLLGLSFAAALPLLFVRTRKFMPFAQAMIVAWVAIGLVWTETQSSGTHGVQVAHLTLLGMSAALFPLAMALASAADAPITTKHLGYLMLDTADAENLVQDHSLADASLTTLPLFLGLVLSAGLRRPSIGELGPFLAPAVLLGAVLVLLGLYLHTRFLQAGQETSLAALERESSRDLTVAPALAVGVELSIANVRRATAPLLGLGCIAITLASISGSSVSELVSVGSFGVWLGSTATCSLMFLLPQGPTRSALGPLAFSLVLLGTTALTIAPPHP